VGKAEALPSRLAPAPFVVAVGDVVVHEREVLQVLESGCEAQRRP
jgi:hypothetical protein